MSANTGVHSTIGPCPLMRSWAEVSQPAANLCMMMLMFVAAEDVLADLGVRQAMRNMPKNARL